MYDLDIVTDEKYPNWRARIVYDQHASEPDGDALAPALIVERRGRARLATDVFVPRDQHEIAHAHDHYTERGDGHVLFERYLRIVHGATSVVSVDEPDITVWIFDTADFRAHIGHTGPLDLTGEHAEWRAWLQGQVYGVIVERRHTGTTVWDDGRIDPATQWRHVDGLWGLYGYDCATETARELLTETAS